MSLAEFGKAMPQIKLGIWGEQNKRASVYVKFRISEKYESDCYSDDIIHDNIPPEIEFVNLPSALNNLRTLSIQVNSWDDNSGIAYRLCSLDGKANKKCASKVSLHVKEGEHWLAVRSLDRAGNSSEVIYYEWTSDQSPPRLELIQAPKAFENTNQALFQFEGEDSSGILSFECALQNKKDFFSCTETEVFQNLQIGRNTFYFRGLDRAGNQSPDYSHSWIVDLSAPKIGWVEVPPKYSNRPRESLEFSGSDPHSLVSFFCQKDEEPIQKCNAGVFTTESLKPGAHIFKVFAQDQAGNLSPTIETGWLSDFTPPKLIQLNLPVELTNKSISEVSFQIKEDESGLLDLTCLFAGQSFDCSTHTRLKLENLSVGDKILEIKARDRASNTLHEHFRLSVTQHLEAQKQRVVVDHHGELDLLFVMDNSSSMDEEQNKMSEKFSNFLPFLMDLDWRIAITTTDMTERGEDYQDGQFVFYKGTERRWIDAQMDINEAESLFGKTIKRREGGSVDESGIGASFRSLDRFQNGEFPQQSFFRENSHLNIVIVSDEDESNKEIQKDPLILVRKVKSVWPDKEFRFLHSVVVLKGDKKMR